MARTALNHSLFTGSPYTVPPGKVASFYAFMSSGGSDNRVLSVNGAAIVALGIFGGAGGAFAGKAGVLNASAGDVISGNNIGLSGWLWDV